MKSIGQNLEESNTYSIFVYAISLKYYKIFRKIFLSSYLLYSFIILFEIPTKPQYMKFTWSNTECLIISFLFNTESVFRINITLETTRSLFDYLLNYEFYIFKVYFNLSFG